MIRRSKELKALKSMCVMGSGLELLVLAHFPKLRLVKWFYVLRGWPVTKVIIQDLTLSDDPK